MSTIADHPEYPATCPWGLQVGLVRAASLGGPTNSAMQLVGHSALWIGAVGARGGGGWIGAQLAPAAERGVGGLAQGLGGWLC